MAANRLANSLSPYLLQHADNPVDWYPWGDEALQRARDEQRPIFLSIGYSACHWCHVMAHESFENEVVAQMMNEHFINIKLDREERPDLDEIYMAATQAMSGHGGWPMSVFLTPELEPFFAGTYYPPDARYGRPGFLQILQQLAHAWKAQREDVVKQAGQLANVLRTMDRAAAGGGVVDRGPIEGLVQSLTANFDARHGGFAGPPKFPDHQGMAVMLGEHAQEANLPLLEQVRLTLEQMALGGIYDQLGGGFSRYSVDAEWLVPHFEKMLYDNACLARIYLTAWQLTGDSLFRETVEGTLDYVLREMTDPDGGFYSAQDADSEGVEGKFFVWGPTEIRATLGDAAESFMRVYDVSEGGNFEDQNILNLACRLDDWETEQPGIREQLADSRAKLKTIRDARIWPGLDDKVLVEWNGLMIGALAHCGVVLAQPRYLEAAAGAANFIRQTMWHEDRLHRVYRGGAHHTRAFQADYAAYADGLLELFCATLDLGWLTEARRTLERMIALFSDSQTGAFFFAEDDPDLLVRTRHAQDNPYPSGNTMAVRALQRMSRLTGESRWQALADGVISGLGDSMAQVPRAHAGLIGALQTQHAQQRELVICGPSDQTAPLAKVAREYYYPGLIVLVADPTAAEHDALVEAVPLLAGRTPAVASAYYCQEQVCALPITEPEALRAAL